ncbi:hypothetical protein [Moraxella sp. ZY210820]|uniref:hypothetical protein n=1 Tax=unclassified Moraxella TaxID=2685852 RepID=UPI002731AC61|nr:hypothetical protein [Moraxella sp. ZY210820]WLF83720.1 hypothetical protein LU301_10790 [Moraxella sp. ZY210820]
MSYYHILIECKDYISTIEQTRDIELFDIQDIQPFLQQVLLPYFQKSELNIDDETVVAEDVLHLSVRQTLLPIQELIQQEQRLLPSETDITISAYEIFNDRSLSRDVTSVIFDMIEAFQAKEYAKI